MSRFNHRLVLENPDMGWPADVLAEAERQREAELMALRPDAPAKPATFEGTILRATPRPAFKEACNRRAAILWGGGAFLTVAAGFAYLWGI